MAVVWAKDCMVGADLPVTVGSWLVLEAAPLALLVEALVAVLISALVPKLVSLGFSSSSPCVVDVVVDMRYPVEVVVDIHKIRSVTHKDSDIGWLSAG